MSDPGFNGGLDANACKYFGQVCFYLAGYSSHGVWLVAGDGIGNDAAKMRDVSQQARVLAGVIDGTVIQFATEDLL